MDRGSERREQKMSDSYWTKQYERNSIKSNNVIVCPHCGEGWNIVEKDHDVLGNILWKCQVCTEEWITRKEQVSDG